MIDFLYSIDKAILVFVNSTLATPVGDWLWPWITGYDKQWPIRAVLVVGWLWLMLRGGARGRTVALLIIPALFLTDRISSSVLKELVGRPRPCHDIGGLPIVQGLHMLVDCGSGKSFPSSHAVNNFGLATIFTYYYRRWTWAFVAWASIVAVSRVAVGVHYPSDIIGGAIIGCLIAALLVWLWTTTQRRYFPSLSLPSQQREQR